MQRKYIEAVPTAGGCPELVLLAREPSGEGPQIEELESAGSAESGGPGPAGSAGAAAARVYAGRVRERVDRRGIESSHGGPGPRPGAWTEPAPEEAVADPGGGVPAGAGALAAAPAVPVGHTAYSWCSGGPTAPVGHTPYSWTHSDAAGLAPEPEAMPSGDWGVEELYDLSDLDAFL